MHWRCLWKVSISIAILDGFAVATFRRMRSSFRALSASVALVACAGVLGVASCDLTDPSGAPPDEEPTGTASSALRGEPATVRAMTPAEVTAARQAIAANPWPRALAELDSQGRPALFHALVEVRSYAQAQALEQLGVYVDTLPIFPDEWDVTRRDWPGGPVSVEASSDDVGTLVYALIPAKVYNLLRAWALAGDPLIPNVILRDVPTSAARDGDARRVRYEWMRTAGFAWEVADSVDPLPASRDLGSQFPADEARYIQRVEALADDARSAILATRENAIAPAAYRASRNVDVIVHLSVADADPIFFRQGSQSPMLQGWGARRGQPIGLRGTVIIAKQAGFNSRGTLDAFNRGTVNLKKNSTVDWCVKHDGDMATVTSNLLYATKTCAVGSGRTSYSATTPPTPQTDELTTTDARTALYASVTDGQNWLRDVAVHNGKRSRVLVGPLTRVLAPAGAFAACGSYYGLVGGVALLSTQFAGPALSATLAALTELTLGRIDVVIGDAYLYNRGVIVHENAHYAMCSLMNEQAPLRFAEAWTDVIVETLAPQAIGRLRGIEHEASWINEGFADFISSQIVGGVNYFTPPNSITEENFRWCDGDASHPFDDACLESNDVRFPPLLDSPPSAACRANETCSGNPSCCHDEAVSALTTLLLDAFDGHPGGNANVPGNGGIWRLTPVEPPISVDPCTGEATFDDPFALDLDPRSMAELPGKSQRKNDEGSRLPGFDLKTLFAKWKDRSHALTGLDKEDFLHALVDTMRARGLNDAEICRTIALHAANGSCNDLMAYPAGELDLDPAVIAADPGALSAPMVLACNRQGATSTVECTWEDVSIGVDPNAAAVPNGGDFRLRVTGPTGAAVLPIITVPYQLVQRRAFALPGSFSGVATITVRTRKGTAQSSPATATVFVPPPGCGDGVVGAGEVCDGDSSAVVNCNHPLCAGASGVCILMTDCASACTSIAQVCTSTE